MTDRGSQFESEFFSELATLIGFHRMRTTAYHPESNGMIERFHRTMKSAIMARGGNWLKALPLVLLGLRSIHNENGFSPAVAVTGSSLLLPRPVIEDQGSTDVNLTCKEVSELSAEMKKIDFQRMAEGHHHGTNRSYIPNDMNSCTEVWIRVDRVRRS